MTVGVLWYLLMVTLVIVPLWRLLPKYGISKYFALMSVVPAIALVLLWIMAFRDDVEGLDT